MDNIAERSFFMDHVTIFTIIIGIAVFFIIRAFWCWYLKINEILDMLHSINSKLDNIDRK